MAHPALLFVLAASAIALLDHGPRDEIVLLPGPDGKVGEVVISQGNEQAVLKSAYASATTRSGIQTGTSSAAKVRAEFGAALAAQPPRPISFILYFESGGNTLTAKSEKTLADITAEIARRPAPEVTAIGHTDTMGDDTRNDTLSKQRAEEVRNILVAHGVSASSITTTGRGERELLVPTADNVDEPRNRRVEVNIR